MAAADLVRKVQERITLQQYAPQLQIKLSGHGISEENIGLLTQRLEELLPDSEARSDDEGLWANVELAENSIGDRALTAVLDTLQSKKVSCKCIKLYRNRLNDEGGLRLARFVSQQQFAVEEIHLSHNKLTSRTLVALCMALAKHEDYPLLGKNRLYIPCWVRMEYNNVSRPGDVLELLKRDGPVTICTADNRDFCGPWRCICAGKVKASVPKVHLFTVTSQQWPRQGMPADNLTEVQLREEVRKWGGACRSGGPAARAAPGSAAATKPGHAVPPSASAKPKASNGAPVWDTYGLRSPAARLGDSSPKPDTQASPLPPAACQASQATLPSEAVGDRQVALDGQHGESTPTPTGAQTARSPWQVAADAAAASAGQRPSLVVDGSGRRRIHPLQLEEQNMTEQFVCTLCSFVMIKPVITKCSHLFCDSCFRSWVAEQVAKAKSDAEQRGIAKPQVPLLPCPWHGCTEELKKQDIQLLDKAEIRFQVFRRLRNNLRVKCVHHMDLFSGAIGQDALRVRNESGATCEWVGEVIDYEEHVRKSCPVELQLLHGGDLLGGAKTERVKPVARDASPAAEVVTPGPPARPPEDLRVVKHAYEPQGDDTAQIVLREGDLVRVFEVTDAGWAAGVRLDKHTLQEIGDTGWFPAGYLHKK